MDSDIINTVVAYIRPFQLDVVVDALRHLPNFPGVSVSDVRGFGHHGAHPPHRGEVAEVDPFTPMVRLEITCRAQELPISTAARACRIRTGEEGPDAVLGGR